MGFDPKIKDPTKIVLATEDAERYVGTLGYFADSLDAFSDLGACKYGMLYTVYADERLFPLNKRRAVDGNPLECFAFFLPAAYVEAKTWRPYTRNEMLNVFLIGHPIAFRKKGCTAMHRLAFGGYYAYDEPVAGEDTFILIGNDTFTLKELFAVYEWKDSCDNWHRFGVEE